ncbi:histone deacetylase family protein [Ferruginivarius sediminum]|uniref:Histone deacetylase family protein n=1 Tax=Ferruginivarius sediminum TaxID=2661937 RepID=A0A369TCG0_9PROT|nr:histone deacetylase family protein [Ferruginivarius sediminum]RDD62970.1 histone deacetylase family protein [Ferruginivarius sediminum]
MQVVHNPEHRRHDPRHFVVNGRVQPNPEVAARVDALLSAAQEAGHEAMTPPDYGLGPAAAVHTPEYLQFLEHAAERWQRIEGASEEVVPNIHPQGRWRTGYPASVVGQAGRHMADTACPIGAGTWRALLGNINCTAHAAQLVMDGAPAAYALCRPGGHHAFADMAGGFCYLNDSAMAAQRLRRRFRRVCVLDVDVHHGNGTQAIFYRRRDVLTVSLHADPVRFYPFFWGHADERGEGEGTGCNLNVPLPRGTADADYLAALDRALTRVSAFAPGALVVTLGLDAYEGDQLKGLSLTTEGFAAMAARIGALRLPTVLVQAGGYLSEALGRNLASFLAGLERGQARP